MRHRVGPGVHQDLHAGLRRQRPGRHRPDAPELHRQAPGQRVHGAAVLRPGLRPAVRGLRLHRAPVLRGDDHRQPHARPEHGGVENTEPATTTSSAGPSRSTGPTSPRAASRRRRRTRSSPGRSRARTSARSTRTQQGPADEPGRPDPDPHARHAGRIPDRPGRPDHRQARLDDGVGRQRLRPHPVPPNSTTCQVAPYAFHPEYSTANPRGNTWSAHTYNVAMSDEIGHFENCLAARRGLQLRRARQPGPGGLDEDDGNNFCVPGADSTLVKINGCFSDDEDWDGQSYRQRLARDRPEPVRGQGASPDAGAVHEPAHATGRRTTRRSRSRPTCRASRPRTPRTTRRSATGPPARTASTRRNGAQFYPFFTTGTHDGAAPGRRAATSSPARPTTSAAVHRRVRVAAADGLSGPGFTTSR